MTTRRQLIQSIPALPLLTAASATALLAACGDKKAPEVAAPATAPAPVAAAPAAPATPPTTSPAPAAATGPLLDEKDPQAVALGYVSDATKTDKVKYAKYADGQNCANCALYQGGTAAQGGCPLFPGKQVQAKAWCSAWAKKAA